MTMILKLTHGAYHHIINSSERQENSHKKENNLFLNIKEKVNERPRSIKNIFYFIASLKHALKIERVQNLSK